MLQRLSVRGNFAWTLTGNLVYGACQWGLLVALAKLADATAVGQFALGLAIAGPLFTLANLNLRAVQITDVRREYFLGDYLGLRVLTTVGGLAAMLVAVIVLNCSLPAALVVLSVGLVKALESVSDILYGLLQQNERMDYIAVSMMAKGTLSVAVLAALVSLTRGAHWGVLGIAAVWVTVLWIYDRRRCARLHRLPGPALRLPDASRLPPLLGLAMPLGIVMLLVQLNVNIPRYFLAHYAGERNLGIYSAMAYPAVAGMALLGALAQASGPRMASCYASGKRREFLTLGTYLAVLGGLLGAGAVAAAWIAGPRILHLLYGSEYAQQAGVFVWLMAAGAAGYLGSCTGYLLTTARYFRVQVLLMGLTCAATTLACAALIPAHGLRGAVFAQGIGWIVETLTGGGALLHAVHSLSARNSELPFVSATVER